MKKVLMTTIFASIAFVSCKKECTNMHTPPVHAPHTAVTPVTTDTTTLK